MWRGVVFSACAADKSSTNVTYEQFAPFWRRALAGNFDEASLFVFVLTK